jgi:hypothetical protein
MGACSTQSCHHEDGEEHEAKTELNSLMSFVSFALVFICFAARTTQN